jgi:hypothetical protein
MPSSQQKASRSHSLSPLAPAFALAVLVAVLPAPAPGWAAGNAPANDEDSTAPTQITFDDWSTSSNVGPLLSGQYLHGAAWGDVDNDGYPDLFAGAFGDGSPNRLLINNADGTFREYVQPAINVNTMLVSGAAFADFDNDGWVDLVVGDKNSDDHTRIYRNDGGGAFTDVTSGSNLDFADFPARTPFTFDYNGDGHLDVLLQHDVYAGKTYQSRLMRGDGNFGFTEITAAAGLPVFGAGSDGLLGLGGAVGDFNGDGTPDIYSAAPGRGSGNWQTPNNRMFLNNGNGTFTEYSQNSVFNNVADWNTNSNDDWPVGAAAGDLNNDGKLDLVAGHHFKSSVVDEQRQQLRVFLNDGNSGGEPIFLDVTDAVGIEGLYTREPHVEIQDMDNDGYMDIVVSVVMTDPGQGGAQRPVVFRNTLGDDGSLGFELNAAMDPTVSSGHWLNDADRDPYYYPGSPLADVDRDGRLDFFGEEAITTAMPTEDRLAPLFRNTSGAGNNWLDILVDSEDEGTNRQGLGSRVLIFEAGHAGNLDHLLGMQEIQVTNGFSSGTEAIAHFGLGTRDQVDVVIDRGWDTDPWWILNLSANTRYTAKVGGGSPSSTDLTGAEVEPGPGDPDASGFASLTLNQGRGQVCFKLNWEDIDGTVTAGHIHQAASAEAGPVVVPLFSGEFDGTDEAAGCILNADRTLVKDLRKNPGDYYVNVHSTQFPDGAVRGQLGE